MPDPSTYNEKELLLRVAEGDERAFQLIMETYHVGVYHAVYRLSGNQWMAEEVVQDLFLKIWLKRTILPDVTHFRTWLNTIAENMMLNAIKQSLRKKNDVKNWVADFYAEISSDANPEEGYFTEILREAVSRLSPRQREAYTFIKEQGYRREDAARQMKVSPETVKTHLEQALRNIRAYCMSRLDSSTMLVIAFIEAKKYF